MKLHIKNMVCDRCKMVITDVLIKMNLTPTSVTLGVIELTEKILTEEQMALIDENVSVLGFELIKDKKSRLIEGIKTAIVELVSKQDGSIQIKLSAYLAERLHHDYKYLSNLFSSVEGTTIEHHFINHKIEKAKELLVYGELSLTDIAYQLGYSSVSHLSGQFKKVTGLTPTYFKKLKTSKDRQSLDTL